MNAMNMLLPNLIALLSEIKGKNLSDAFHASRKLGLLIERHCQDRYADTTYELLLSNNELNELRLSDFLVNELVEELFFILENYKDRGNLAVWPLGRTFDPTVIDRLLQYLKKNWTDDTVCSGILMTVYDSALLEDYWDLIKKIAKEGQKESKQLADQLQKVQ